MLDVRLYALSGADTLLDDQSARDRCIEDLRYTVVRKLDLPHGHAVQLVAIALHDWCLLPEAAQVFKRLMFVILQQYSEM